MLTNQLDINKPRILPCSQDRIEIEGALFCAKCKRETKRGTKKFTNCRSLYSHLITQHSGSDKNSYPTRDECVVRLQNISNEIQSGVLK